MDYKITAHIYNDSLSGEIKKDYDFIANTNNDLEKRKERIMKYPIDGRIETHNTNVDYFIDEDGDGVYLLEKLN